MGCKELIIQSILVDVVDLWMQGLVVVLKFLRKVLILQNNFLKISNKKWCNLKRSQQNSRYPASNRKIFWKQSPMNKKENPIFIPRLSKNQNHGNKSKSSLKSKSPNFPILTKLFLYKIFQKFILKALKNLIRNGILIKHLKVFIIVHNNAKFLAVIFAKNMRNKQFK